MAREKDNAMDDALKMQSSGLHWKASIASQKILFVHFRYIMKFNAFATKSYGITDDWKLLNIWILAEHMGVQYLPLTFSRITLSQWSSSGRGYSSSSANSFFKFLIPAKSLKFTLIYIQRGK